MIYGETVIFHHLCDVAVRELVSTMPSDAQKNNGGLVVTPLERGLILFQEYDSRRVLSELDGRL